MTMKVSIKEQYLDKFHDFVKSIPQDGIEIDTFEDNTISLEEAKIKVEKALNNISLNQGLELNSAFQKVISHS
jgi:hypothetical protein